MANIQVEIRDSDVTGVLDLLEGELSDVSISQIGTDTADLTKRGGAFSTSFTVPATKANDNLLDHIYHAGSMNAKNVDKDLESIIKVDGEEIQRGFIRIQEIITTPKGREYKFKFFGENADWSVQLRNTYLKDLSFDNNSIKYDASTISNSWSNNFSDEWVFALINRGQRVKNKETSVEDYLPELFLRQVLIKAFEGVGYKLESSFFDSGKFKQLILTFFGRLFNIGDSVVSQNYVRAHNNLATLDKTVNLNVSSDNSATEAVLFNDRNILPDMNWQDTPAPSTDSGNNISAQTYTAPINSFINFTVDLDLDLQGTNNLIAGGTSTANQDAVLVDVYMFKNATTKIPIQGLQGIDFTLLPPGSGAGAYRLQGSTGFLQQQSGDTFQLYYDVRWNTNKIPQIPNPNVVSDTDWDFTWYGGSAGSPSEIIIELSPGIPEGARFNLNQVLDDKVPLLDIVNDVSRMFNLRWRTNNFTKVVQVEPRNDFIKSFSDALDWSDKLDISKDYSLTLNSLAYDESLDFEWADDGADGWLKGWEDDWGVDWAEYSHNFPAKFKDGISSFGTKKLAATHYLRDIYSTNTASANAPYTARIWKDYGATPPKFSNNHAPRVLEYRYATQLNNARFIFEGVTYQSIPYATMSEIHIDNKLIGTALNNVRWDDWQSQAGLVNTYYSKTLREIEEGKKLKAFFNLKIDDWKNLDFRKPIYLDERFEDLHGYWVIERIDNYSPAKEKTTKIVLSEARNYEPVSITQGNDQGAGGSTSGNFTGGNGGGNQTAMYAPPGAWPQLNNPSWILNNNTNNTAQPGLAQLIMAQGGQGTASVFGQQQFGAYPSTGSYLWAVGNGTENNPSNAIEINSDGTMSFLAEQKRSKTTIATDTTLSTEDIVFLDNTTEITLWLPPINQIGEKQYLFKDKTGENSTHNVTFRVAGGQNTIDGQAFQQVTPDNFSFGLIHDSTSDWCII